MTSPLPKSDCACSPAEPAAGSVGEAGMEHRGDKVGPLGEVLGEVSPHPLGIGVCDGCTARGTAVVRERTMRQGD